MYVLKVFAIVIATTRLLYYTLGRLENLHVYSIVFGIITLKYTIIWGLRGCDVKETVVVMISK